ncbi:MAG: transporter [Bacteroidota bacterium]
MISLLLIGSCLFSGVLLRRTAILDANAVKSLNGLLIYFFIPILTLYHIPRITFEWKLIWLTITPFAAYLGSLLYIRLINLGSAFDKSTEGAMIMTSGIGSISFVGFPIFELLYGQEGLAYGIVLSLAGTLLVFNTLGLATGLYYSGKSGSLKDFLARFFTFPPFLAFLLAISTHFLPFPLPELYNQLLGKLSAPFSVMAIIAIGAQIQFTFDKKLLKSLLLGNIYKLLLSPLLVFSLLYLTIGTDSVMAKVCILGSAIGSMNAVSILAARMDLNPPLAALMPAIGIPVSIGWLFVVDILL